MPLAMFSDLLSALTIHIYSFYLASARIYHWQLTILQSLFHLFRGKKHNVLRNRIDSCDYDLDQLLVGTILFTLLFFLLPTVVVFYLNFAIARMIIISMKAGFDTLLSCLNHFPLFALMLRIKDERRLPGAYMLNRWLGSIPVTDMATGGIRFELRDTRDYRATSTNTTNETPTSIIYLKVSVRRTQTQTQIHTHAHTQAQIDGNGNPQNAHLAYSLNAQSIPLDFGAMFHQYSQMAHRIRKHYLSPRVLLCLLTGQFVPPINRKNLYSLQYSMLPARRATVWEMWRAVNMEIPQKKPFQLPIIPPLPNGGKRMAGNGRARAHY